MSALTDLRRSTADRKLTGLCGGVAQQWRIDPLLVRVLAVLLVLSGGLGLVLYAFGWLTVPEEGSTETAAHRLIPQSRTWPREVWIAILVVAGIVCLSLLGQFIPLGLMPAVIIGAVWYFGFRRTGGSHTADAPPPPQHDPLAGPSTPFTEAARAWQARVAEYQQAGFPTAASAPEEDRREPVGPAAPVPPTPPRPYVTGIPNPTVGPTSDGFYTHPDPAGLYAAGSPSSAATTTEPGHPSSSTARPSTPGSTVVATRPTATVAARRLRLLVLVVAGLALAGLGLADVLGVPVAPVVYLATALLVIGLGLVVAGWVGRARGLLPIGVLLLIATVATYAGTSAWQQVGDQWTRQDVSYATLAELPATDQWDVGTYRIDLSRITVAENRTYEANLDVGQLVLTLPADQRVRVEASTDAGSITMPGDDQNGTDLTVTRTFGPSGPSGGQQPVLTIKVHVDAGSVQVNP